MKKTTPHQLLGGTAAKKNRTRETVALVRDIEFLRRRDPARYAQAIQLVAQAVARSMTERK